MSGYSFGRSSQQAQAPVLLPPGPGMLQGQAPAGGFSGMNGGGGGGGGVPGGGGYGYVPQGMQGGSLYGQQGGGFAPSSGRMSAIAGPSVARSLGTMTSSPSKPLHLVQKTLRDVITGMRQHKNPTDQQRFLHKCMAEMREEARTARRTAAARQPGTHAPRRR